jgi:hypothetical protein
VLGHVSKPRDARANNVRRPRVRSCLNGEEGHNHVASDDCTCLGLPVVGLRICVRGCLTLWYCCDEFVLSGMRRNRGVPRLALQMPFHVYQNYISVPQEWRAKFDNHTDLNECADIFHALANCGTARYAPDIGNEPLTRCRCVFADAISQVTGELMLCT